MVIVEIDKNIKLESDKIKYSQLEKIILFNFFKDVFKKSLEKEWYNEEEKKDFIESYISSFNKKNLINI